LSASDDQDESFVDAGLLDGLDGRAREARLELLRDLAADGVAIDELERAAAEDRLALLPVDRVLASEPRYTAREVAELAGLPLEYFLASRQAVGLARPDPDLKAFGEEDLEAQRIINSLREAGVPEEGMLEVTRVLGRGLAQGAEAIRMLLAGMFAGAGATEHELATGNAEAASQLLPQVGPLLSYILRLHLLEQTRSVAISQADLASGASPNTAEVFVAFADLVGFTRLGERVEVDEIGRLAVRLTGLAQDATRAPTRIIKTIGDAVMFVSPTVDALLETGLGLIELSDEADQFPPLRVGVAAGVALSREGDWYGRPVNLASRVTSVARPGSLLATGEVRDAARDGYQWSAAGEWRLKGFKGRVALFRARRPEPES
jgi:adenylate cyclase